jgi:hypothetical protein
MVTHPRRLYIAVVAFSLLLPGISLSADARQPGGPEPLCQVSTDPTYGRSVDNPIAVGGSPVYGAARQRRYLDALRGPEGQAVRYTRSGSVMAPDNDTMLDRYQLTYDGLDTPVVLYLDWYHFTDTTAPVGFVCGAAFDLGLPPPDPSMGREQMSAFAGALAKDTKSSPPAIPLGGDPAVGVVLDEFRVLARGIPPVQSKVPLRSVIVAYPQTCEGQLVAPTAVRLVSAQGQVLAPEDSSSEAARLAALSLGTTTPRGSVAAFFRADPLQAPLRPYVEYGPPCAEGVRERTLAIDMTRAQLAESPMPARPAEDRSGLPWIAVQALIDLDGRFQEMRALGGPDLLVRAAIEAVRAWRVTPAHANGAPLSTVVVLQVSFTPAKPH